MKRYKICLTLLLVGMVGPLEGIARPAPQGRKGKPNIIYIQADHLGYGDLGCNGQRQIETPHIDALAQSGMNFSNHYAGQAEAVPSRCALFTGLHMGHAPIRSTDHVPSRGEVWNYKAMLADSTLEGQRSLPANTVILPRKLKAAGYVTACVGQWGLGAPGSESTPRKMGFDFFYGYFCDRQARTHYPPFLYRNEHREYLNNQFLVPDSKLDRSDDMLDDRNYLQYELQDYAPALMIKEVHDFVDRHQREPFALFLTTTLPRQPLQAPQRWVKHYVQKWGDESPYLGESGGIPCRYPRATYAAMVSYLDEQIGEMVKQLKSLDLYENTLIVFTSHPATFSISAMQRQHSHGSKSPIAKLSPERITLHEEGIHAPLIACWPKEIEAGTTSDMLSAIWDMAPTFCDVAGVEAPEADGVSLLSTFRGKHRRQKTHDFLYWECPEGDGQIAIRLGQWKAIVKNVKKGNRKVALYDLATDPNEQSDVAELHADIIQQVLEIFRREHTESAVKCFQLPLW